VLVKVNRPDGIMKLVEGHEMYYTVFAGNSSDPELVV
jgi:hypothetical protein